MKLSEAILLGSTVLAPKAGGQIFSESQAGCALGMAAVARGCTFRPVTQFDRKDRRTLGTEGVWGSWVLTPVPRPCQCWRFLLPREMRIKDIIAHLFDHHVMRKKNWTMEQLVEWVRTVEPNDAMPPATAKIVRRGDSICSWQSVSERSVGPSRQEEEEEEEWQAVRQAFAAHHQADRKRERLSRSR
jgi:hypothetical protein